MCKTQHESFEAQSSAFNFTFLEEKPTKTTTVTASSLLFLLFPYVILNSDIITADVQCVKASSDMFKGK